MYMNPPYWIEFLDEILRTHGNNILQNNICIIFSSLEIMTLDRLCAIIHITIYLMTRWLEGNVQIIADYKWSEGSIERTFDDSETALEAIEKEGGLILNEKFIMVIFQGIMNKLPPFEKYWTHMFQK